MANGAENPTRNESQLAALVAEALANNPEIAAARDELDAARQRVPAAGALDDPMMELGVVNAPLASHSLRREDMTMTMLGLGQRLPFPGKRGLRRAVAAADAESIDLAAREIANRIARDVRVAYEELAFNEEAQRIVDSTRVALEQLAAIARSRYEVGQAAQNDVLDAHIELERLGAELLRLAGENSARQSELQRLLGRSGPAPRIHAAAPQLAAGHEADPGARPAIENRPQLQALQALVERSTRSIDLAQRDYYPDFDVKLQYGQRDRALNGMARDDMVSLTVGFNLPLWRKARLEPQVAEARAMRRQAQSMLLAQQLETQAALDAELALVRQWRATAELYQSALLPQARASTASALAAYRVGRVEFLTLRQAQLREYEISTDLAMAVANHNKAIAEIELLVGSPT
ncbi:MAG TPA: TolC family protein [Steroidobacteraceae bacterium]|nr:TolC family protein [Steroidobacteraceae bacterium]